MSLPLVSIVIPTYNQASYIEKALLSAIQQTYSNLEIIIADDHSSDDIKGQVQKFLDDKRVKYFRNEKNIGRVRNYKKSIEEYASGDWVLMLDGDDYLTDKFFINDAIKFILEDKKVVFVQAGHTVRGNDTIYKQWISLPDIEQDVCKLSGVNFFFNFNSKFSHLATLYKRSLAVSLDFYRLNILSSDVESILRLSLLGNIILLKRSVGIWFQHSSNATRSPSLFIHLKNILLYKYCKEFAIEQGISKQKANNWEIKNLRRYMINEVKKSWQNDNIFNRVQFIQSIKIGYILFKRFGFHFLSFSLLLRVLKNIFIQSSKIRT